MKNYLGFVFLLFSTVAVAQEVDNGADEELSLIANSISNVIGDSATAIAELSALERSVVSKTKLGLLGQEDAATALMGLSGSYFYSNQYEESSRLAANAIDFAPDSYVAAQGWIRLGHISMMKSETYRDSTKAFKNADKIILKLLEKIPDDNLYKSRSLVLSRLGLIADCTNQPELACQYYQELVDSPDLTRCGGLDRLLVAHQVLATDYAKIGNKDASIRHFESIEKFANEGKLTPAKAIPLLVKRIHIQWPNPVEDKRIQSLEELWSNEKYQASPEILIVGDELVFHYFFAKPLKHEKFKSVATDYLDRMDRFRNDLGEKDLATRVPRIVSCHQSLLVLLTDFHQGRSGIRTAERFIKRFENDFAGTDPQFSIPETRPVEHLTGVVTVYQRVMSKHWLEYQKRLKELKDL